MTSENLTREQILDYITLHYGHIMSQLQLDTARDLLTPGITVDISGRALRPIQRVIKEATEVLSAGQS